MRRKNLLLLTIEFNGKKGEASIMVGEGGSLKDFIRIVWPLLLKKVGLR